jgi:hypothetical protein
MIVDRAIYRDGRRTAAPGTMAALNSACRSVGIAWIGLYRPDEQEFAALAREFDLHPLVVEDAVHAHQRPQLERYGETLLLVLCPARYIDETETEEFGEVHVFAGPQFVMTVRHAQAPNLHNVREKLEARPDLLGRGPVRDRACDRGPRRRRLWPGCRRHRERRRPADLRAPKLVTSVSAFSTAPVTSMTVATRSEFPVRTPSAVQARAPARLDARASVCSRRSRRSGAATTTGTTGSVGSTAR